MSITELRLLIELGDADNLGTTLELIDAALVADELGTLAVAIALSVSKHRT